MVFVMGLRFLMSEVPMYRRAGVYTSYRRTSKEVVHEIAAGIRRRRGFRRGRVREVKQVLFWGFI